VPSTRQYYASFAHLGTQLASRRRRQPRVRTDPLGLDIGKAFWILQALAV
jgi:hypothetical protein